MIRTILFLALIFSLPASAQVITPGPSGFQRLYSTGVSVGNGADTTQDTLHSYTLVAGQMANVGDVIHIRSGGTLAATTDNKTVRLSVGGQVIAALTTASAGVTSWVLDAVIIKTGSSTQSYLTNMTALSGSGNTRSGTLTLTDTSTIAVLVTGQDNTAGNANAITAQLTTVDYQH